MRRFFAFTFCLLIAFWVLPGCNSDQAVEVTALRLIKVGPFSANLELETSTAQTVSVEFGEGTLFDKSVSSEAPSTQHALPLIGLKPSTRYTYRIEPGGPAASFRTAPGQSGSFDLVILDTTADLCASNLTPAVLPDIVVVKDDCKGALATRPESVLTVRFDSSPPQSIRFGAAQIILATSFEQATKVPANFNDSAERLIYVLPKLPAPLPVLPKGAVLITARQAVFEQTVTQWAPEQTAWIEIDAFEVAWVAGASDRTVRKVIVEAPPETKKTCLYCDRLLESGRYEESLNWYRNFILENNETHLLEDAYFSMARILDEKLFRYKQADAAYREFLDRFPKSRKKILARYRLDYIGAHTDHDFEPLARFEKAKAELVRKNPMPSVEKVEALIAQYPDAGVTPEALFWLGHLLESTAPDRALMHYRTLIENFGQTENARIAAIAIGDVHYRQEDFPKAIAAYNNAATIASSEYRISIAEKIRKSERNIFRQRLRFLAWGILAGWLVLSLFVKARPSAKDIGAALVSLAIYALVGGIYIVLTYDTTQTYAALLVAIAIGMSLALLWNRSIGNRVERFAKPLLLFHSFSASIAILYLIFLAFHQIYVFGL